MIAGQSGGDSSVQEEAHTNKHNSLQMAETAQTIGFQYFKGPLYMKPNLM